MKHPIIPFKEKKYLNLNYIIIYLPYKPIIEENKLILGKSIGFNFSQNKSVNVKRAIKVVLTDIERNGRNNKKQDNTKS